MRFEFSVCADAPELVSSSPPLPSILISASPSARLFFVTMNANRGTSALKAAVELGLFGVIGGAQFVPKEDRISPPPGASFSLVRLGTTPGGETASKATEGGECDGVRKSTKERI